MAPGQHSSATRVLIKIRINCSGVANPVPLMFVQVSPLKPLVVPRSLISMFSIFCSMPIINIHGLNIQSFDAYIFWRLNPLSNYLLEATTWANTSLKVLIIRRIKKSHSLFIQLSGYAPYPIFLSLFRPRIHFHQEEKLELRLQAIYLLSHGATYY